MGFGRKAAGCQWLEGGKEGMVLRNIAQKTEVIGINQIDVIERRKGA
jgi:hypothetical protein